MNMDPRYTLSDEEPDDIFEDEELDFENDNDDYFDDEEDDVLLNSADGFDGDEMADLRKHYYPYFRDSNGSFAEDN